MTVTFEDAIVLVTGGTRGLGKAIGKEFARRGASVVLTHRWSSVEEHALRDEFTHEGAAPPLIVESDASDPAAVRDLMRIIAGLPGRLRVVVSNVAVSRPVETLEDLKRASLELSLRYSAWPIVELPEAARAVLGYYPRYLLATSTDGAHVCHPGYDMAGVAKAALETLCRYLAVRLRGEGVRVNALRPGFTDTISARAMFGDQVVDMPIARRDELMLDPADFGRACIALCSGLMDAVTGQVITVDHGTSLLSPITYLTGAGWPAPFPRDGDAT